MKPLSIAGLVLVVLGAIALVYGGISFTSRDTVVDAGPIQISADRKHGVPIPPVAGALAIAAGIALFLKGRKS